MSLTTSPATAVGDRTAAELYDCDPHSWSIEQADALHAVTSIFDLERNEQVPRTDVWPPSVARVLNNRLGEDYPVHHERTR